MKPVEVSIIRSRIQTIYAAVLFLGGLFVSYMMLGVKFVDVPAGWPSVLLRVLLSLVFASLAFGYVRYAFCSISNDRIRFGYLRRSISYRFVESATSQSVTGEVGSVRIQLKNGEIISTGPCVNATEVASFIEHKALLERRTFGSDSR
jgi:hypothetical protein